MTAFQCAIDSVVRAVGRIVVCVEAEAEVSTVMIRSLLSVPPRTPLPSALSTSSSLPSAVRKPTPWKDCAAGRDDHIDQDEQDGREHGGLPRPLGWVLGLLVDRHAGVPAPVDEHAEQHRDDEVVEAHRERVEPVKRRLDRASLGGFRCAAAVDLDEGDDREQSEDQDLGAESTAECAPRARSRRSRSRSSRRSRDRRDDDRGFRVSEFAEPEELERVHRRDVRQRRHHDDVRQEDRPAVEPAGRRGPARAWSTRTSCPRRGRRG